jgi:hypothetical protein
MKWTLLHPLCPCSTPVSGGLTNLALVLLPYVKTRGVSDCGLTIYIKKYVGKRRIMEISPSNKYNLQKIL